MIGITVDSSNVMEKLKKLSDQVPKEAKAAIGATISRLKPKVSPKITETITDRYAVEPAQVKKNFRITKAMIPEGGGIDVSIKGPRIGMIHFAHTQAGVNRVASGKVLNASGMKALSGKNGNPGFVGAAQNSGSLQIFARAGAGHSLEKLISPSIPEMAGKIVDLEELEEFMDSEFLARLAHEIDFRLSKLGV